MKTLKAILTGLIFLLILPVVQANEAIYALQVDGLGCPFCAYGIEKQLSAIDGVANIAVDISTGQVFVTMQKDVNLDKAQAQKAVTDAGFTLRSFNQSSEEKLDVSGQ